MPNGAWEQQQQQPNHRTVPACCLREVVLATGVLLDPVYSGNALHALHALSAIKQYNAVAAA
jgi:1-aminocyclopropane-1-carboxylate deaminase/D-cysteine desulfhydrase-like pyridoxal-dependent ACC family enzyme